MALTRWRNTSDMMSFQDEVNRLFNDFFQQVPSRTGLLEGSWNPTVDVSETDSDIVVRTELPGVSRDDVKVSITDDVLTIRGEKKQETTEDKENYHRTECCYGTFQRSFRLPLAVEGGKAKAFYQDGVLKVTIPKAVESKTKDITINIE